MKMDGDYPQYRCQTCVTAFIVKKHIGPQPDWDAPIPCDACGGFAERYHLRGLDRLASSILWERSDDATGSD